MNLDYLVGRRAESVVVPLHKEDWKWAILFDDGTRLTYKGDAERPTAGIENTVLGSVEVEDEDSALHFYKGSPAELEESVIAPTEDFEIEWAPKSVMAEAVTKQTDPAEDLPPDPSAERVAEGPQEAIQDAPSAETASATPDEPKSLRSSKKAK